VNARTEAKTGTKESRGVTCLLSSERAAFGQSSLSTGRLAQDRRAAGADDDCLCVRVDGCDGEAAGALDIHEEGSGSRNEVL
jgi:hypothetical protein